MGKIKRAVIIFFLILVLNVIWVAPAIAATTADVTVTWTPAYIAISDNATTVAFGVVNASSTSNTSTAYVNIDNTTTTVITDVSIKVTGDWTGGAGYTHSDTATPGVDTVGLVSQAGGTWAAGSTVIVKKTAAYNNIKASLAASTNFTYGLSLLAPTSFTHSDAASNTVTLTSVAH
jgi:hypothetical protein